MLGDLREGDDRGLTLGGVDHDLPGGWLLGEGVDELAPVQCPDVLKGPLDRPALALVGEGRAVHDPLVLLIALCDALDAVPVAYISEVTVEAEDGVTGHLIGGDRGVEAGEVALALLVGHAGQELLGVFERGDDLLLEVAREADRVEGPVLGHVLDALVEVPAVELLVCQAVLGQVIFGRLGDVLLNEALHLGVPWEALHEHLHQELLWVGDLGEGARVELALRVEEVLDLHAHGVLGDEAMACCVVDGLCGHVSVVASA